MPPVRTLQHDEWWSLCRGWFLKLPKHDGQLLNNCRIAAEKELNPELSTSVPGAWESCRMRRAWVLRRVEVGSLLQPPAAALGLEGPVARRQIGVLAVKRRDTSGRRSNADQISSEIAGTSQSTSRVFFTFPIGLKVSCPVRLPKHFQLLFLHDCNCPSTSGGSSTERYGSIDDTKRRCSDTVVP